MRFETGHEKKGGRKKGTPNKATQRGRELAQAIIEDPKYQRHLRKRLRDFEPPCGMEILLWAYAFGRPLDPNAPRKRQVTQPPQDSGTGVEID